VLELTGTAESFNFGYSGAAALGFNFLSQNLRADFLANDQLEFDWYPVPNGSPTGYSQLYNIVFNSQGGGFVTMDGYGNGNENCNQFYYAEYTGILHHIVVNYSAYKDLIFASANPDGGAWLELAIQPNAGSGAPADEYFDNFKLSLAGGGPTNAAWAVNADGNWSVGTNWTPSAPNASGAVANFGSIITAPRTVTVDQPETTGTINFDNANKYTIAGTSISNTLTLDNSTAPVGINVVSGSHDINAPLVLAKDAVITVTPAGSTLSLGSLQASTVGITKSGAGNLAVNNVRAGSLTVSTGQVTVTAGRSPSGTSNVKNLSVAGGTTLDLNDQDLVYDYSGATPLGTVRALLVSGYNGGGWNGTGINSTSANLHNAVPGAQTVALGYAEASAVGISGSFSGQTLTDATNVVIRYTYTGDSNLDGTVDTVDFNLLASNFSGSGKDWSQGDYNYDGNVDSVDFNLLASNFSLTLPAGADFANTLVPEPTAGLVVGALGLLGMARRRRK
jgi:hypothetical protein